MKQVKCKDCKAMFDEDDMCGDICSNCDFEEEQEYINDNREQLMKDYFKDFVEDSDDYAQYIRERYDEQRK